MVHLRATFSSPFQKKSDECKVLTDGGDLVMTGRGSDYQLQEQDPKDFRLPGAVRFRAQMRARVEGGSQTATADSIAVSDADSVVLMVSVATNVINYRDVSADQDTLARKALDEVKGQSFDEMLARNIAKHRSFFDRVKLDLGEAKDLPTDERIASYNDDDFHLIATYFQFGRYLLISCSQPDTNPANLQGIWNNDTRAPWNGKFTLNINTPMNYWPAERAALPEMHDPLFRLVRELAEAGQETARAYYDASGWIVSHNTDGWRHTCTLKSDLHRLSKLRTLVPGAIGLSAMLSVITGATVALGEELVRKDTDMQAIFFLDKHAVAQVIDMKHRFFQPERVDGFIELDRTGGSVAHFNVYYDPNAQLYQAWYRIGGGGSAFCYAESRDGVNWENPQLPEDTDRVTPIRRNAVCSGEVDDRRPCYIFFHGGGWKSGDLNQGKPFCEYLSSRGIVAMTANYSMHPKENEGQLALGKAKEINGGPALADGESALKLADDTTPLRRIDL
jgi:hypothetical protein